MCSSISRHWPRSFVLSAVHLPPKRIKRLLCHSLRPHKRPCKNEWWTRVHRQMETKRAWRGVPPRSLRKRNHSQEVPLRSLLQDVSPSDGAGRLGSWIGMDIAHHPEDRKGRGNLFEFRQWCILVHGHMGSRSRCAVQISLQDG